MKTKHVVAGEKHDVALVEWSLEGIGVEVHLIAACNGVRQTVATIDGNGLHLYELSRAVEWLKKDSDDRIALDE